MTLDSNSYSVCVRYFTKKVLHIQSKSCPTAGPSKPHMLMLSIDPCKGESRRTDVGWIEEVFLVTFQLKPGGSCRKVLNRRGFLVTFPLKPGGSCRKVLNWRGFLEYIAIGIKSVFLDHSFIGGCHLSFLPLLTYKITREGCSYKKYKQLGLPLIICLAVAFLKMSSWHITRPQK